MNFECFLRSLLDPDEIIRRQKATEARVRMLSDEPKGYRYCFDLGALPTEKDGWKEMVPQPHDIIAFRGTAICEKVK